MDHTDRTMDDAQTRRELRQAVFDCRERRLNEAAKWASQQLAGMDADPHGSQPPEHLIVSSPSLSTGEEDAYQLALCHFDFREYLSANNTLHKYVQSGSCSNKTTFMYLYSLYLSKEKQRTEKKISPAGLSAWATDFNYLTIIRKRINDMGDRADGFLFYLLGLVHIDVGELEQARHALSASLRLYPCNWSAWKALLTACPDHDMASTLNLPDHYATAFFKAALWLELHNSAKALDVMERLSTTFKDSDVLLRSVALAYNNIQMYDEAEEMFKLLLERDPHRIDGMDTYSNIIYVKEDYAGLAALARRCSENDPYRPETCCVIGNYYSLRGQHEKSIVYFRRALKLDPGFIPAWTLMGHDYVELKNPSAAIEAYQKAVSLCPNDYRAWYGLGQTYELINMPAYALHYFDKAAQLRPKDARMWNAIGHCYASSALDNIPAAIRCYERALENDKEGVAIQQLAVLHQKQGDKKQAAKYYLMNLERIDNEALSGQDELEALRFLAQYYKEVQDLPSAQRYYERLLDYGAVNEQEGAKAELKTIQEQLAATRAAGTPGGLSTPGSDMGISPPR